MGVSTDGILFFGIAYEEDEIDLEAMTEAAGMDTEEFDDGFADLYLFKIGAPVDDYDARIELSNAAVCEVGTYCSYDYPMYFACVKKGLYRVNRGYAAEIPDGIRAEADWAEQLKAFCALMGLPYRKPKWLLVSLWG
jgi:hypothetical protein